MEYKQQINAILVICWLVLFTSCNRYVEPSIYEPNTTQINTDIVGDEDTEELIEPYKEQLDAQMNRVIGVFAHDMYKKLPESELGNFMCDAPQEFYNATYGESSVDFTMMNFGGIRTNNIPAGEVTVGTMFELMPFENQLVIVEIPGSILKDVLDRVAKKGGWPISNNVNLVIENNKVREFLIAGEPLDETRVYNVMLSDYIVNGGDGMDMLADLPQHNTKLKLRDVLISYCEWKLDNNEQITARITGRIIIVE